MLAWGFITPLAAITYSGRDSSPLRARKIRAVQWDAESWGKAVVRGKISLILLTPHWLGEILTECQYLCMVSFKNDTEAMSRIKVKQ